MHVDYRFGIEKVNRILLLAVSACAFKISAFIPPVGRHLPFGKYQISQVRNKMATIRRLQKLESPSAERNKEPIWNIVDSNIDLEKHTDSPFRVLEIAAGSGVHTVYLASKIKSKCNSSLMWYPTDMDDQHRQSISAHATEHPDLESVVQDPLSLTLDENGIQEANSKQILQEAPFQLILNINMIHISPWSATQGLMREAATMLAKDGTLLLYGPYKVNGTCCPSNESFDASLRSRNPQWGVRDLGKVVEQADLNGLRLEKTIEMPANNLSLLFRKKT